MKKLLPLLAVVLAMTLCLASCSFFKKDGENTDGTNNGGDSSENQTPGGGNQEENKPACNHVTVVDQAVAATCTEDGLTAGAHCSICNEILVKQDVIPAAHTYCEWVDVKTADCFFDGEQTRACSVCEYVNTKAVPHLEHIFVQNEETKLFACETCDARILNGHLYATFSVRENWYSAYKICNSIGGHLVTITSAAEQALLTEMVNKAEIITEEDDYFFWTGAINNTSGWEWTTGEEFEYTHWSSKEPDNSTANWHISLTTSHKRSVNKHARIGEWEDLGHGNAEGFICEWELDIVEDEHFFTEWETTTETTCFNDGEQHRICTHCGLEETKVITKLEHSFIFNEATGVNTCEHCAASLYDGRIYKIFNVQLSWFDAYSYCNDLGGHLVTITSAEEQTFVETYFNSQAFSGYVWLGAYNDGAKWHWVTEEAFEYSNWSSGEPDCSGTEFFGETNWDNSHFGEWHDHSPLDLKYILCEWEAE